MNQVTRKTVSAVVDLSRITEAGEYQLPVEVTFSDTIISTGLTVLQRTPAQITVVDSNFTEKDDPVQAVFDGSVAEGFQAGKVSITPETLHISGETSVVDRVDHAQVVVTGDNLSKTVTGEFPFDLVDAQGNVVEHNLTCSTDTIFVTLPIVTGKDVPLTIGDNTAEFIKWWDAQSKDGYETLSVNSTPSCGAGALWTAVAVLNGKSVPQNMYLPFIYINQNEIATYSDLQAGEIASPYMTYDYVVDNIFKAQ